MTECRRTIVSSGSRTAYFGGGFVGTGRLSGSAETGSVILLYLASFRRALLRFAIAWNVEVVEAKRKSFLDRWLSGYCEVRHNQMLHTIDNMKHHLPIGVAVLGVVACPKKSMPSTLTSKKLIPFSSRWMPDRKPVTWIFVLSCGMGFFPPLYHGESGMVNATGKVPKGSRCSGPSFRALIYCFGWISNLASFETMFPATPISKPWICLIDEHRHSENP